MTRLFTVMANLCAQGFIMTTVVIGTKLPAKISFEWWLTMSKANRVDGGNFVVLEIVLVFIIGGVDLFDGADLTLGSPLILINCL